MRKLPHIRKAEIIYQNNATTHRDSNGTPTLYLLANFHCHTMFVIQIMNLKTRRNSVGETQDDLILIHMNINLNISKAPL